MSLVFPPLEEPHCQGKDHRSEDYEHSNIQQGRRVVGVEHHVVEPCNDDKTAAGRAQKSADTGALN